MHGGVILFRGTGADAMRYVESDRSRADDYYLGDSTDITYTVLDGDGETVLARPLDTGEYAGWVDWINPDTGERMGVPRLPGPDRLGSPRFAEMVINAPKSLSIAAALHPEVSEALDAAQQDALSEIQRWLGEHSVTRVGPRGAQEVVPVERMRVVGITHRTSRAGDPHRHIHMQVGTRVWAAGKWRALDTGAMFKQQGMVRALGTAVIAASPELAEVLDRHGLTLDPVTGEVAELEPFNALMSKRGAQVRRNLERLEVEWEAAHPGETMGPVVSSRLTAQAWAHERPAKKPTTLREEAAWLTELREAGYDPERLARRAAHAPVRSPELSVQVIASRALDRCAAASSTWTRHDVQEHATRIITEHGLRATPTEVRELIGVATRLALEDCFSVLPESAATPEHVAHNTSLRVVQSEIELRDLLTARVPRTEPNHPDVAEVAARLGKRLDTGQLEAAAAVASSDPLVIVEGAAGAGKTTMLGTAITAVQERGRSVRVLAPTKRAADVAQHELGVPATSVAALVHAHGYRWNIDGVWSRLTPGDADPDTGGIYTGTPPAARLQSGEQIVVDEAGMLDQDTALALFTVAAEAGATVALVGDRAQLPAVGRGGVLDIAAQYRGRIFDMTELHRFNEETQPGYATLTLRMRDRENPGAIFDDLTGRGLVVLHADADALRDHLAEARQDGDAITAATSEEAMLVNERIRDARIRAGIVDDTRTVPGSDGLSIGAGDLIQTRQNDTRLEVANRQQWIVQHVDPDGTVWARDAHGQRKHAATHRLPAAYVREHAHLSYAATAYGVQGLNTASSHTILTGGTSGAAVYVGMTRGRDENLLHIAAENPTEARALFIDAMERDRADRGLVDATERAAEAVRGLLNDGPVKLVHTRIAHLTQQAVKHERNAEWWTQVGARLTALQEQQQAEQDAHAEIIQAATKQAEHVRAEVVAPLTALAAQEGGDYLASVEQEARASRARSGVGRFGQRAAQKAHEAATQETREQRGRLSTHWGTLPTSPDRLPEWTSRVAEQAAARDARVLDAQHAADTARADGESLNRRHRQERLGLFADVYGAEAVRQDPVRYEFIQPDREATNAASSAAKARREADRLRDLPVQEAATRIEAQHEAAEQARAAREERARKLNRATSMQRPDYTGPHRDGPSLGL